MCIDYQPPRYVVKAAELFQPPPDMTDLVASLLEFSPSVRSSVQQVIHHSLFGQFEDFARIPRDVSVDMAEASDELAGLKQFAPDMDLEPPWHDDLHAFGEESQRSVSVGIGPRTIRRASSDLVSWRGRRQHRLLPPQNPACRCNIEQTANQIL